MKFTDIFIRRPVLASVVSLMLLVLGIRSFYALPNLCPHQRGPLCEGGVSGTLDCGPHTDWKLAWIWDGEVVTCPWHALEFHIPTGQCVAFEDVRLRTYEVRVVDGELRVVI